MILKIRMAWWFLPYLRTVEFFALITGMSPDDEKVNNIIRHAVRIEGLVEHG